MQTETTKTAETCCVVRRPITYYLISVVSYTPGGGDHRDREVRTRAVSLPTNAYILTGNEKIIDCVPAAPGSVEVFVQYLDGKGRWHEEPIGIEVPGADAPDWPSLAKAFVCGVER